MPFCLASFVPLTILWVSWLQWILLASYHSGGVFRNLDKIEPAMDADSAVPDAPPQEFANGVSNEWHSVKLNTLGFKISGGKHRRII